MTVYPDTLIIDGQAPARPDQAIIELAGLMHDRLIGTLRVERDADALDWHALLLLLAQSAEEVIAEGGIGKAWEAAGRQHFEIHEIDYAEVLREREGARTEWDQIIAFCLRGDAERLDEDALMSLLDTLGDSARVRRPARSPADDRGPPSRRPLRTSGRASRARDSRCWMCRCSDPGRRTRKTSCRRWPTPPRG